MKGTQVAAGTTITTPIGWPWPVDRRESVVAPACAGKAGLWACITHKEVFANNFEADVHEHDDRRHAVVWLCPEHGPEGPVPAGQPVNAGEPQ